MPDIQLYLLGENSSGSTQVVSGQGASIEILHDYGMLSLVHAAGLAAVRFDPEDRNLPWRRGDILVALSSTSTIPYLRSTPRRIDRLRPSLARRGYEVVTIWSDNVQGPIRSIALDNAGNLYFSVEGKRTIWRLDSTGPTLKIGRRPPWQTRIWAVLPSSFDWAGDFTFAPDGSLVISSGIGASDAQLRKFDISSDPGDTQGVLKAQDSALLFDGRGVARGLCFYAPDQAIFVDGNEALSTGVDPSIDPDQPPAGDVPKSPNQLWDDAAFFARDVDVPRVEWEDLLAERPNLRTAISWTTHTSLVPYPDWGGDSQTQPMRRVLHRMYGWLGSGKPAPLSYLSEIDAYGNPRIGPEVFNLYTISTRDAQELYVAHLAMKLWVAVKEQTPWGLDSYSLDELKLLFEGELSFSPTYLNGMEMHLVNAADSGMVMPDEPLGAYRFILGESPFSEDPSMLRRTRRASIFALTQWVLDHIFHGPGFGPTPQDNYLRWGYQGFAPLVKIYSRTESPTEPEAGLRFWSWNGCQSTTGLMVHFARLLLIPVRGRETYEWPVTRSAAVVHAAIDFPTDQLAAAHTDDFYATVALSSPTIRPDEIYNGGPDGDYFAYVSRPVFSPPPDQPTALANWTDHLRTIGRIAGRSGTHAAMERFWADARDYMAQSGTDGRPDAPCEQVYLRTIGWLRTFGLTEAEAIDALCPFLDDYWAEIDAFMAANDANLSGPPPIRYQQGWTLYNEAYLQWYSER